MNDYQTLTRAKKLIENSVSYGRANRRLAEMLSSEEFLHAVFNPKGDKMGTMEDISACTNRTRMSGVKGLGICRFSSALFAASAIWSAIGRRMSWLIS